MYIYIYIYIYREREREGVGKGLFGGILVNRSEKKGSGEGVTGKTKDRS